MVLRKSVARAVAVAICSVALFAAQWRAALVGHVAGARAIGQLCGALVRIAAFARIASRRAFADELARIRGVGLARAAVEAIAAALVHCAHGTREARLTPSFAFAFHSCSSKNIVKEKEVNLLARQLVLCVCDALALAAAIGIVALFCPQWRTRFVGHVAGARARCSCLVIATVPFTFIAVVAI